MKDFLKKLKSFSGFVGTTSTLIPGISFFLKYSPPLFDGVWILVCALSAAFLWFGYKTPKQNIGNSSAKRFILAGFIIAIIYLLILDQTSILVDSNDKEVRYQIGWNVSRWSLEKGAIDRINNRICKAETKEDLLYCYTASSENTFRIWKRWTIYVFGIFNILTFTTSCLLWSYGWGKTINSDN